MVFRASYKIERSFAGLVLGKKGKGMNPLKEMPGVHNVFLDRKASTCTLRVAAVRQEYCDAVYQEVIRRINSFLSSSQSSRFLIDVEDRSLDTAVLVPCRDVEIDSVVIGTGNKEYEEYIVSSFVRGSPCNGLDLNVNETAANGASFMEFNYENVVASFQNALDVHRAASSKQRLYFHVSLGKMTFTAPTGSNERYLDRNELTGPQGGRYLTDRSMGTFFNPNIAPHYLAMFNKKLALLDFVYREEDRSGNVVLNFDECKSGLTNCSIELSKNQLENNNPKTERQKPVKIVKYRQRMRNLTSMSADKMDVGASLTSYREKETELTEGESKAFQLCWEDWESVDELVPEVGGDGKSGNRVWVSCLKQVVESYTWVKEIPFPHGDRDTTELTVRMKRLNKKSRKFGVRDNCVEVNFYFSHDRTNVTGEELTAEMMELRKWIECLVD